MLVSVWLDSELSEFELAMMRAHLLSCPSCAAHADNTVALTGMLRLRPLEPLPCPVFIPHRQRGGRRVIGASVAVAAIVAAIGVGLGTAPFSTSRAVRGSLPAAYPTSHRESVADRRPGELGRRAAAGDADRAACAARAEAGLDRHVGRSRSVRGCNVCALERTIETRCIHLPPLSAEHSTMPTALRPGWNDHGSPVPVGRESRDPIGYGGLQGV